MMSDDKPWMTAEERAARVHRRNCSECNLCCKLLPVPNLHPANTWCQHAVKGKGCGIYATRPNACRAYACMWLSEPEFCDKIGLARPDKAHFVIDEGADIIGVHGQEMPAIQVWVDPGYPTAWRSDKALRTFIEQAAGNGVATLIRYGDMRARAVLGPQISPTGQWFEQESVALTANPTTEEKKRAFFGVEDAP
jgi:hypothetical protein